MKDRAAFRSQSAPQASPSLDGEVRVGLSYQLRGPTHPAGALGLQAPGLAEHPLFALLQALRSHGSIRPAAQSLGLSYRHVWGELKRWEGELGRELVVWTKGQRATLAPFGEKLMWAEQRAQARLRPQLELLRGELERVFVEAFDRQVDTLSLCAGDDPSLLLMRDLARQRGLRLDLAFRSTTLEALRALDADRCTLAGFHVRDGIDKQSLSARLYRPWLRPGHHKLIECAYRTQGLMVQPGNPLRVATLADLVRPDVHWATHAPETGTRILLDELFAEAGLAAPDPALVEPTHDAVAAAVASGAADAAFGLEAAARAARLQFIPLARERYALLVRKSELQGNPALRHLMDLLGSPAWRHVLGALPGYAAKTPGTACALGRVLPWWYTRGARQTPPPQATAARTPRPKPMTQRTQDVVQAALA
ncbi:substrate-binding domain-containing protein [Methylibium sp.]|uniref:substrate-binding domain-containing protein n=1 Tax=Methylibium sp. TaxID=2067992 RepID=UPI00333E7840